MSKQVPEEVVQAATDVLWAGPDFNRKEPELRAKEVLEAIAPALLKQGAEEERERLRSVVRRHGELAKELRDLAKDEITQGFTVLRSGETVTVASLVAEAADLLAALTDNQEPS